MRWLTFVILARESLGEVEQAQRRSETEAQDHEALLAKLSSLREPKLPNETGGVLLGSFDVERRILYIADALPSPPDSEEWPTLYIRGLTNTDIF